MPSTSELYDALAKVGARFDGVIGDALDKRAARLGSQDGIAAAAKTGVGEHVDEPDWWMSAARKSAFDASYRAGVRIDIDSRIEQAKRDHAYDPEGFKATAEKIVSGFIQGAPGDYAVEVEQYAQGKVAGAFDALANQRLVKDQQESLATITARETELQQRIRDIAAQPDGENSTDFLMAVREWDDLNADKAANPLFAFTPEQATIKRAALLEDADSVVLSRNAVAKYTDAGRGLPGYAAAKRLLSDEFASPVGAMARVDPTRRARVFRQAVQQLDAIYAGDRETARAVEAEEREKRQARRDLVGDLRLGIMTGGIGRAEILNADLDEGEKASLLTSLSAQARREAAEARAAGVLERAGRAASYREFSDAAAAGTLSSAELAEATQAGLLTAGQARTLSAKRDKTLKPIVDDVMSPLRDAFRGSGFTARGTAQISARAEEEAVIWARMNPDAPLEERLKVGGLMAKKYLGERKGVPGPAVDRSADVSRARLAKIRELSDRHRRGLISDTQFRAERAALMDGPQ